MKTEEQPEPSWAGLGESIINSFVYLFVFLVLVPVTVDIIVSMLYSKIIVEVFYPSGSALSPWITFGAIGIPLGILSFGKLTSIFPLTMKVGSGMVQFLKCRIPGIDITRKLGTGTHVILPIFQKWGDSWRYMEKWTAEIKQYRATTSEFDVLISAVATFRPHPHHLLPLHLLVTEHDKETKCRQERAITNMMEVLKKTAERTISHVRKHGIDINGQNVEIPSSEVIIEVSEEIGVLIEENLESQPIITKHGLTPDTFSLGDINLPVKVEQGRDAANAMQFITKEAREAVELSKDGTLTEEKAIRQSLTVSGAITETVTTEVTQVDTGTIAGIGEVVLKLAALLSGKTPPTPTSNIQPPTTP